MGVIQSKLQIQTVEFDIAKLGTGGGAVGSYNLGAIIPKYSTIYFASIDAIALLNSAGGLATIAFGVQPRGSAAAAVTNAIFPVALSNSYLPATGGFGNNALNTNPLYISSWAAEMTATIAVEAITGGKCLLNIYYIEKLL